MFSRKLFAASATALMLFGVSQANAADLYEPALPDLSAVISLYGGGALHHHEGSDGDFDKKGHWQFGGDARVAGEAWQAEIVGSALGTTSDDDSESAGSNYLALAGHWMSRGEMSTIGVFGGFSTVGHQDTQDGSQHVFGGLEYASFQGNSTWFGQVGGITCAGGDCTSTWESGVFGRGGYRYFFSEMSKVEIDGMIGWGYFNSSDHDTITAAWGVEYEHQFSLPFAAFVAYKGHYVEEGTCGSCTDSGLASHGFLVGFRIDVNSGSLLARDRTGAGTFDIPDFHRAVAWPDES